MSNAALSRSESRPRKFNSADGKLRSSQLGVNLTDSGPLSRNGRFSAIVPSDKKNEKTIHPIVHTFLIISSSKRFTFIIRQHSAEKRFFPIGKHLLMLGIILALISVYTESLESTDDC